MLSILEQLASVILGIIVLTDIFLIVLHARADSGLTSRLVSYPAWRFFVWLSKPLGRWRGSFLSYSGPLILVMVLAAWFLLLSLAAALIIHPSLGTAIRATHGETPTDFATALYVGGNSLAFVGTSDFAPQNGTFRWFYLLASIIGMALVPLIITYLLEVYASLRARNSLGLEVHLHSAETGDAADVITALYPPDMFHTSYVIFVDWAAKTTQVKEAHQFHPILFYFRFSEPFYSVSRRSLVTLDTVSLIRSALDEGDYGWLKKSAALEQLWITTFMELNTLVKTFLPKADVHSPPDEQMRTDWQARYAQAVHHLESAGIKTSPGGAEQYISLRSQWDGYITALAPMFAYDLDEIDTP